MDSIANNEASPNHVALLSQAVRDSGIELGFDVLKIAPAISPPGYHPLIDWIANGYHADMDWIERRQAAYEHPNGVLENTRSVIVVALNYHNPDSLDGEFRISRYAHGSTDYHSVLKKKLKSLTRMMRDIAPQQITRPVVDTAPLLERDFARLAGIGWFGKNTMLISREIGSWFFLGAILTTAELEYDAPFENDYCGSCEACLQACPTNAFPEPGVLDANRCISYLTIERRTKPVDESLRAGMGNWVFGCDICQDVCPWNRFAPSQSASEFQLREEWRSTNLETLLELNDVGFRTLFKGTPLERTGRDAIVRNAAIAAGNQKIGSLRPVLTSLLSDSSPIVSDAAAWAITQMDAD